MIKASWNRKAIHNVLNKVYPTYSIGQHYVHDKEPYIVLKAASQQNDIGNALGGWQVYNVMCYVTDTSIALLDEMLKRVVDIFKGIREIEITGIMAEDYHETEIRMYMRYVEIRVPKEV